MKTGFLNPIVKKLRLTDFFWVLFICTLTTILSVVLNNLGIGKENSLMIFLVGVLTISVLTTGYMYGFISSVISVMMFNYFFTEPLHSFAISNLQDYILIFFFLVASIICGTMSSKFQSQTKIARRQEKTARILYEISESFLHVTGIPNIVNNGIHYIYEYTGYPCSVILDKSKFDNQEEIVFTSPNFTSLDSNKYKIYSLPIQGLGDKIGMITLNNVKLPLSSEYDKFLKTVIYQMALVLDHEFIYNERERIKRAMEREHIKSTLLRSISHDLRTPLTGITGASAFILESFDSLQCDEIKKLISDIHEESKWLMQSIQNILNMTRISEGQLIVEKEYEAVDDLINQAVTHILQLSDSNRLRVFIPEDIILIYVDGKLIVQVLINLLTNALEHSGIDTIVELKAYKNKNVVVFQVSDNGIGIDDAIKDTLFDEFVTVPRNVADSTRGIGLGLSICKSIITAHNGIITAANNPGGGALFKIELPYEED